MALLRLSVHLRKSVYTGLLSIRTASKHARWCTPPVTAVRMKPSAPRPAVQVIVVGFARGAVRMHALEDGEQRWRSHGHRDDVTALVVRARGAN